jgi:sugar/nucleoside kinase (ribokinase family)
MLDVRLPFAPRARQPDGLDLVSVGLNSVDLLTVVAAYPAPNTKQPLRRFLKLPGGQAATAAHVCARLGWRTAYIGAFGDDDLGALARRSLMEDGVDVSGARVVPGATNQFAVVLVDERTGERTVLWHRHPGLRLEPPHVPRAIIESARMLTVDCHETAAVTEAARVARAAGVVTLVDVEKVRPGIDELLQNIDAVIAAEDFPQEYTGYGEQGRALHALAQAVGAPLVAVTLGAEGSLAVCGGREIRTPGFRVEVADSTGAGDAFRGGFAAACLSAPTGSVEDALAYANAVAALNCRGLGARGGMPTVAEVEALLSGRAV